VTAVWVTIGVLAVATAALKLAGPLALGGRPLRPRAMSVVELLASALLAALVVVETFGTAGRSLTIDARVVGVAFAAVLLLRRAPMVVVVLGAAAATALTRLLV
jgi:branched chain amino acid efflux pump